MNNEVLNFLGDFVEACQEDIRDASVEFDRDDFMRIVAAAEGFGAFIQKIIEEKKTPDDRPLKGKI